jgi:hypothetical protein
LGHQSISSELSDACACRKRRAGRSEQVIEHVHSGGEQDALIGLAGAPGDQFRQECFANTWISDKHDVGSFGEEGEIEQAQEPGFGLQAAFVVMEVKGVDTGLGLEARESETPFNGALRASFDFHVGEPFQSGCGTEILGGGIS